MKEQERKQVIEGIKKIQEEQKLLKEKRKKLIFLSKHPIIKRYLKLINDINITEEKLKFYDSLEEIINWEFSAVFRRCRKDIALTPCNHEIWIYDGSYYLKQDRFCEHDIKTKEYSEDKEIIFKYSDDWDFLYNRYICLECGKKIETKDWKQFEHSNFVLKNQNRQTDLGTQYYVDKYYQLLYNNNITESQNIIIDEFNKNKEKVLK